MKRMENAEFGTEDASKFSFTTDVFRLSMNNIFEKLNRLSYPTVLFIAASLTAFAILPIWIYIRGQQTRIVTRAVETIPLFPTKIPTPINGPIPASTPTIIRAYPWIGKAGDVIIIEGTNFGSYPKNRRLSIGDVMVPDINISSWEDTRIEAIIPNSPKQGGTIALRINAYPIVESLPLVFYDQTTIIRLRKQGSVVSVEGLSGDIRATLYTQSFGSFGSAQDKRETTIIGNGGSTTLFTLQPSEEISSIILTDAKGTVIPYTLNPTEFGF